MYALCASEDGPKIYDRFKCEALSAKFKINQPNLNTLRCSNCSECKKWMLREKNIKDVIGSELNVFHLGLLYRCQFKYGEVIFQKTICHKENGNKIFDVTP